MLFGFIIIVLIIFAITEKNGGIGGVDNNFLEIAKIIKGKYEITKGFKKFLKTEYRKYGNLNIFFNNANFLV